MASWDATQAVLKTASNKLIFDSLQKIHSTKDLHSWLHNALVTYPNPLVKVISTSFVASILVFALSIPSNNYSWVDKSWSILPVFYAWVIALHTAWTVNVAIHPRLLLIAGLVTIWGIRLTYNFWRKGGYSLHGEDYRWPIVRKNIGNPILFQIFNLTFIAIAQNILLAALLSPAYVAWTQSYGRRNVLQNPLNEIDIIACIISFSILVFEAIADQQQWNFHQAKAAAKASSRRRLTGDIANGFISSGLWRYSRHPNFFAEQSFWWSLSLFATAATGHWYGWWLVGAAALTLLFQSSTSLTEDITASKYPAYAAYQQTTSRLVPWFVKKQGVEAAAKVFSDAPVVSLEPKEVVAADTNEENVVGVASRGRSRVVSKSAAAKKKAAASPASSVSRSRSRPHAAASTKKASAPRSRSRPAAAAKTGAASAPPKAPRRSSRRTSA